MRGDIAVTTSSPPQPSRAYLRREDGTYVHLGSLRGDTTIAFRVNDARDVVGISRIGDISHAFRWRDGVMTDLGVINGDSSQPVDLNERGQVLVESMIDVPEPRTHPFIWDNGRVTDLNPDGALHSNSSGMNERSTVALTAVFEYGTPGSAFLWRDGEYMRIALSNDEIVSGLALNDRDEVAGLAFSTNSDGTQRVTGFLWREGRVTIVDPPAEHDRIDALFLINLHGQIAGDTRSADGSSAPHAFTWKDGRSLSLDSEPSHAIAMNNRGQIAGVVGVSPNQKARLWETSGCFGGEPEPPPLDGGARDAGAWRRQDLVAIPSRSRRISSRRSEFSSARFSACEILGTRDSRHARALLPSDLGTARSRRGVATAARASKLDRLEAEQSLRFLGEPVRKIEGRAHTIDGSLYAVKCKYDQPGRHMNAATRESRITARNDGRPGTFASYASTAGKTNCSISSASSPSYATRSTRAVAERTRSTQHPPSDRARSG
jgi:probable HAF family extracellular repeat protein